MARGWGALGLFWAVLILLGGAAAAALEVLGPVRHAPAQLAETHVPVAEETHEAPGPQPRRVAGPEAALLERVGSMSLPKVAADGRLPRLVYAAPVSAVPAGAPRIALLIAGFGQAERESRAATDTLPGPVSFAVSASAVPAAALVDAARAAGHELFASIPMEPSGFPSSDEGPHSLLTGLSMADNRTNLEWSLAHTPGAVGATGASDGMRGERFAEVSGAFDPVLDEIARRGLLYVDPRPGRAITRPGLPARTVDVVIDDPPGRADIEAKLAALERTAREKGAAIGLAGPLRPVTIERIAAWAQSLEKRGFVLVPVSALVNP